MPYRIEKVKGGFKVSSPTGTRAKKTSKRKAKSQIRLLNAVDHGFVPRKSKKSGKRKVKWS